MLFFLAFGLCVAFDLCLGIATADIYVYVDREGLKHFTDTPTTSEFRPYLKEQGPRLQDMVWSDDSAIYDGIIVRAAKEHGIAFQLIKAVIWVESDFNPRAISKTGAKGLMHIMPENVNELQIKDPFDPTENIMGGVRYLKKMLMLFDEELPLALAAYNAGPGVVRRYQRIPPFRETEAFVEKVLAFYHMLK